jgi:hypothetical protein
MPSAETFARHSSTAPNPNKVNHSDVGGVVYTCHMAAMHWAFMDHGDNQIMANQRVSTIATALCNKCCHNTGIHSSILHEWYGNAFCNGAIPITNKAALYHAVNIGDVLIVGEPQRPVHTMIVTNKRSLLDYNWVYIRGFNNIGTLGTGGYLAYDNNSRDINKNQYWHGNATNNQTFGNGLGRLFVIPFRTYSDSADIVRRQCTINAGIMTYHRN